MDKEILLRFKAAHITGSDSLRAAFTLLHQWDHDEYGVNVRCLRLDIQQYYRRCEASANWKIIKHTANEGHVEMIRLPEGITDLAEAESYYQFMYYRPITEGSPFYTKHHRIVRRGDRLYLFHEVAQTNYKEKQK